MPPRWERTGRYPTASPPRRNPTPGACTVSRVTDFPEAPAPTPLGPPVFGSREWQPEEVRYRRFGLEVETEGDRFVQYFEVYPDIDGGALYSLMNAHTEAAQGNAVAALMATQLRDNDGVPSIWRMPTDPAVRDDYVPSENADEDDPWEKDEQGRPLYERWDGELVTADELTFDELEDGSSRRRFGLLMDSTRHRIQYTALAELAQWLVKEAVARPTRRSARSQTGSQPTQRGRTGKRR